MMNSEIEKYKQIYLNILMEADESEENDDLKAKIKSIEIFNDNLKQDFFEALKKDIGNKFNSRILRNASGDIGSIPGQLAECIMSHFENKDIASLIVNSKSNKKASTADDEDEDGDTDADADADTDTDNDTTKQNKNASAKKNKKRRS